ncbi:MAG TPA: cytochrome c oxidase assembly protein [Nocardioides sp.]|uniref:cytochrome c oxidase assembly protein n=1 Tax=Nocardioides sp. TaxID=35761 RepID=UPI002F3FCF36
MTAALAWSAAVVGGCLLLAGAVCYIRGLHRLHRSASGRSHLGRPWAVAAAVVVAGVVTAPPLGELLEERLSTHMAQHMTLILVSAPLLALSRCGLPLLAGLPRAARRPLTRLQHRLLRPAVIGPHLAWGAYIGALWLWHLPAAYDEAVASTYAHVAEHACFLLTAWLFWWHLFGPARRRLTGPAAVLYVAAAIPPGAALGALLTFIDHPLYPAQAQAAHAAGADVIVDQRIGGLVMWVPMDFFFVALAVVLVGGWLRALQRRWPEPEYGQIDDPVDGMVLEEPSVGGAR